MIPFGGIGQDACFARKKKNGGNSSVKELLVQGHAKVVGNGAQVIVGDGLSDDAAAHAQHLDVDLGTLLDGVGNTFPPPAPIKKATFCFTPSGVQG